MSDILGQYINNYTEIFQEESYYFYKKYRAINRYSNKYVMLKIINKQLLKLGEYNYLLKKLRNKEIISKLCDSEYIVKFYQKFETPDSIIFEYEYFEENLYKYLQNNHELKQDKNFYKYIIVTVAKALIIMHQKGAMHRNINPNIMKKILYLKK